MFNPDISTGTWYRYCMGESRICNEVVLQLSVIETWYSCTSAFFILQKNLTKEHIIDCSFSLRCAGTLSFLHRLVNYSIMAFFLACDRICMWMQLRCVYSDGSERKCPASFSHTLSCNFAVVPFALARCEKGRKNEMEGLSSFASEEADGGLVFLFPFVLLAPSADGNS